MVRVMPDWGGGGNSANYNAGQNAVNALKPKPAPKPPAAIARPAPAPAPFMGGINRGYIAPVQNYVPKPSPYAPGWAPAATVNPNVGMGGMAQSQNFGTAAGGGGGGGTAAAANTQAAAVEKPISEADWLAGDTEYQNEIKGYDDTLKDFLSRITTQESDFKTDYDTAVRGFGRNRDRSMLGLGEDFTSRGLANSGMFADARTKANTAFEEQETGMDTAKTRGLADFGNQRSDKTRATDTQKGNARRASLARMAQKQSF